MRIAVIVNPVSGLGTVAAASGAGRLEMATRLARLSSAAADATDTDIDIDVLPTKAAGHAAELAAECVSRGYARVIAWGGDGTINEVAGPLIGTRTSLAIVPSGSGDGLARGLGLSRNVEAAFAAAVTMPAAPLDVGQLGDRHFLNIAGIGFDAAVASTFNRRAKRGRRGYVIDSLRGVWSYESRTYDIDVLGKRLLGPHFVIAFANGPQYGSGLVLAPDASFTDGQLDMVLVSGGSAWRQLWRARRLAYRRMAPAEGVLRARITSASVRGEALHGHVDGQTFEASGTLAVSIKPKSLLVAGVTSLL